MDAHFRKLRCVGVSAGIKHAVTISVDKKTCFGNMVFLVLAPPLALILSTFYCSGGNFCLIHKEAHRQCVYQFGQLPKSKCSAYMYHFKGMNISVDTY